MTDDLATLLDGVVGLNVGQWTADVKLEGKGWKLCQRLDDETVSAFVARAIRQARQA